MFKVQIVDDGHLRKMGWHAGRQRTFSGHKRIGLPSFEHPAQWPRKPPSNQPWTPRWNANALHLHVGTQLEHLVVWPVDHQKELIVGATRHQAAKGGQREPPNAFQFSRHQQPSVQGNACHEVKGTAVAHYLRVDSRINPVAMPQSNPMESTHLLVFIYKNLKTLLTVGFLAAVAAAAVSFTLDEYYESTVIMFATNQNSLGEQFFEELKKNDLMAYGETEDAERLLQILNSNRIQERVIEKYALFEHYDIDPDEPGSGADMGLEFNQNVSASLTRYGSIQIRVYDTDPEKARDMANDMAFLADSAANAMRNERASEAYALSKETLAKMEEQIGEAEDSLATLHSLGIYDLEAQVTGLTAQYGTALAAGNLKAAKTIDNDLKRLGTLANGHNNLTGYLEEAYEQHALLKKRVELMRVDAESQISSSFIVDYAYAADKKAKPVRWLIVVITSVVAVAAAFIGMLAWDNLKQAQTAA